MRPFLKWTLISVAVLLALCLLSPMVFAKDLVEDGLKDEGFTSISLERKSLMRFGFEAFDKRGQKCTGHIDWGYLSSNRNSLCHSVANDADILEGGTKKLLERAKLEFGEIDCGEVKLEDTEAQCDVSPVGEGTHLTVRYAHEGSEWKLTGPTTVWHRDDLEADVRKQLTEKGNAIKAVDCGQGLLGADLDEKLTCTVTLEDASVHDVEMTFGKSNYKWSSDLL